MLHDRQKYARPPRDADSVISAAGSRHVQKAQTPFHGISGAAACTVDWGS